MAFLDETGLAELWSQVKNYVKKENEVPVGDTLLTARADLGDKWLLCNGASFSSQTYPNLAELLMTPSLQAITPPYVESASTAGSVNSICYHNGVYVMAGGSRDKYARPLVWVSNSSGGPWTNYVVATGSYGAITSIVYDEKNSRWAAIAGGSAFVASDPRGTWTRYNVDLMHSADYKYHTLSGRLAAGNGQLVAPGHKYEEGYNNPVIAASTNGGASWVDFESPGYSGGKLYDAAWSNGAFFVVGDTGLLVSTGTLTNKNGWKLVSSSNSGGSFTRIIAHNGKIYIFGRSSNFPYCQVADAATVIAAANSSSSFSFEKRVQLDSVTGWVNHAACVNGKWFVVGVSETSGNKPALWMANDIGGPWTSQILSTSVGSVNSVAGNGPDIVITGDLGGSPVIGGGDQRVLPVIPSNGGMSTYIKATEG